MQGPLPHTSNPSAEPRRAYKCPYDYVPTTQGPTRCRRRIAAQPPDRRYQALLGTGTGEGCVLTYIGTAQPKQARAELNKQRSELRRRTVEAPLGWQLQRDAITKTL